VRLAADIVGISFNGEVAGRLVAGRRQRNPGDFDEATVLAVGDVYRYIFGAALPRIDLCRIESKAGDFAVLREL
jgi:hypothetical protein